MKNHVELPLKVIDNKVIFAKIAVFGPQKSANIHFND